MGKNVFWAGFFILIAVILQSTLLSHIRIYRTYVSPDLALGILVFTAYINGTMTGQLTGFFSGFLMDFISAAPLGFNAFIRTILGAGLGAMKGTFFLDVFFLPMGLCAAATLVKALLCFILHLLFAGAVPAYSLGEPALWLELTLNTLSAPLLFGFLKFFNTLLIRREER
ncbi:MAG: rod shape-determining protein MreD [Spirochaetaceae bacterium]|jgi:rod shape-determining protein MreD|nr:rod shape-determining protein MreD [Spirochaetaceae bacterium]